METWKDIPGYDGKYQVSNLGNVRSTNWRNTNECRNLFLKRHKRGYLQVELAKDGQRKFFTVHRLVAMCFVDGYADGCVVNHINEDKTDNRAENLEWCTQQDNVLFSIRNAKCRCGQMRRSIKCKTRVLQFEKNGTLVKEWESPISIKRELGFSDWSIKQCCLGKRATAYGYLWQFAT